MFEQIKLSYDLNALEPYIDELTMVTHYTKHHAAYTKNFNAAVEKLPQLVGKTAEEILAGLDAVEDEALRGALRNNGGGFWNHNLYFSTMAPNAKQQPEGKLQEAIDRAFGSFDAMKEKLSAAAAGQFGSGWAWLSANAAGELRISSSGNQDNPLMETKGEWHPILGIDVWEHAYYLKYKNLRADYISAFFHVADWAKVEELYSKIIG